MEFDSSRAWGDATETVSANREVLLPLAGVFLVLPSFAMAVMRPQPQVIAGASPRAVFAQLSGYFSQILPFYVVLALASLIGTLAILALFTDATRPTVGEAIRQGARALLVVFGAQLLVGLTIGAIGVALVGLAVALQLRALIVLIALPLMVGLIYISVRLSLVNPAVVVDGLRSPVAALRRSWELTRGNVGRLLLFYFLLALAFAVLILVIGAVLGAVLGLALGTGEATKVVLGLVLSTAQGIGAVYFIAVTAAVHRQLAGPSGSAISQTFE